MRRVAILGFHKIGASPDGWESWFYVPESTFAAYLSQLDDSGWQVIDCATFLNGLVAPEYLPERAALLTFDDGYRSIKDVALPWLLRFEYPAVLFVPSDFIGKVNSFDSGDEPEETICSWADLREVKSCGVAIQSHGASHRRLSELTFPEQEDEILRSKAVLESGIGEPVQIFSYPYGDCGSDCAAIEHVLSRAGYRAACLYGGGTNRLPIAAPFRLTRLAIGPDTDLMSELELEAAFQVDCSRPRRNQAE